MWAIKQKKDGLYFVAGTVEIKPGYNSLQVQRSLTKSQRNALKCSNKKKMLDTLQRFDDDGVDKLKLVKIKVKEQPLSFNKKDFKEVLEAMKGVFGEVFKKEEKAKDEPKPESSMGH